MQLLLKSRSSLQAEGAEVVVLRPVKLQWAVKEEEEEEAEEHRHLQTQQRQEGAVEAAEAPLPYRPMYRVYEPAARTEAALEVEPEAAGEHSAAAKVPAAPGCAGEVEEPDNHSAAAVAGWIGRTNLAAGRKWAAGEAAGHRELQAAIEADHMNSDHMNSGHTYSGRMCFAAVCSGRSFALAGVEAGPVHVQHALVAVVAVHGFHELVEVAAPCAVAPQDQEFHFLPEEVEVGQIHG